jgi:hypothetical protein
MDRRQVEALKAAQEALIRTWHDCKRMLETQLPFSDSQSRDVNDQWVVLNNRLYESGKAFTACVQHCVDCDKPDVLIEVLR